MVAVTPTPLAAQAAALRASRLSTGLSDSSIETLAAAMCTLDFARDEVLIRQGEPGDRLYLLTAGRVEVRVRTPAGSVTTLAQLAVGDCVGEMSLLTGDVTSAEVVAIEASQAVTLGRTDFDALVRSHPQIIREFVRILSRHLSAADAAVGQAREEERRLAQFIQDERAENYGELIGKHSSLAAVKAEVARQAKLSGPLFIQGEKGSGREAVARLIHLQGPRREGPIISAECAQVTETPWGDKLFGAQEQEQGGARSRSVSYLDLAAGGTLLLREIEALPAGLQDRLAEYLSRSVGDAGSEGGGVRIIVSAQRSLEDLLRARVLTPSLAGALGTSLAVPSLRERKRDIPELANYFVKRSARRRNRAVEGLDSQAVRKLVCYDFRIGNVLELMETIERAVILTEGPLIEAHEIFLQPAATNGSGGWNLLASPGSRTRQLLRVGPKILQGVVAVFFAGLLGFCFLGPAEAARNPATLLVWSVWWPALVLSFMLAGRAWCALCPMALAGNFAQKFKNLNWRIPAWLKENDTYVIGAGFLLIIWVEEVTRMRESPFATGLLLLAIGTGAVTCGILFPRRTWCRHLCPLGGVAGLCSTTAAVELRPTADVCAAKCKGHCCYKGDDQTAGCPMFNHVMFVNTNQHCVLCMNCVMCCPDRSPRLNFRVPGKELWFGGGAGPQSAALVAMLIGLVTALVFLQRWESGSAGVMSSLLAEHRISVVTLMLLGGAAVPLTGLYLGRRYLANPTPLWQGLLTLAPLMTAGFACFQLGFVPGLGSLLAGLEYQVPGDGAGYGLSFSVLGIVRVALLVYGLLVTAGAVWKLAQGNQNGGDRFGPFMRTMTFGGAASFWALLLVVLVGLEGWGG